MPVADNESHWIPPAEEAAAIRNMTVADLLDEAAQRWPRREAIVYSVYEDRGVQARWSFQELRERGRRSAKALIAADIGPGERIAVWATNLPQWLELQFGAAYAGAILVPMNPLLRSAEILHVMRTAGCVACFAEPVNRGVSLWQLLDEAARELPTLRLRVAIGQAPDARGRHWAEWLAAGAPISDGMLEARRRQVTPDDTSQIQFTSGTTGFPKGAELTNRGVVNDARLYCRRAELPEGGRHVNASPFFHCGGSIIGTLGCVASGTTQIPLITFEAERMARAIAQERATSTGPVPTMMIAVEEVAEREGHDLSSVARVITGGTTVPIDLLQRWRRKYGARFSITYGLTEASPIITQSSPSDPDDLQMGSCGQALPWVEFDIVDAAGNRVALGADGEVRTRGWHTMKGYVNNAEATRAVLSPDGWLSTGDFGRMDARGYLWITGRAKDIIIRGGENIYPKEIEDALLELDEIADAHVVGVPDARYGEEVCAYLQLKPAASISAEQLRERLHERIARYKVPKHIRVVEAFPLTPSGKVQKFKLRELFAAEFRAGST